MSTSPAAPRAFTLGDFDFTLPPELIAQHPAAERSASRLLDGTGPQPVDRVFRELPGLLRSGDLLVFNDTQVVKARLFGEKASGGKFEILIERVLLPHEALDGSGQEVVAHIRVSKKPQSGGLLHLVGGLNGGGFDAVFLGRWPDEQGQLFRLRFSGEPHALMAAYGHVPLPPYIEHGDTAEDEAEDAADDGKEPQQAHQGQDECPDAEVAGARWVPGGYDALHGGSRDGAMAILVGIGARKSIQTGQPVKISDLTDLKPKAVKA